MASLAERFATARRASNPSQQEERAEVAAGAAGEKQFLERFRSDLGNSQKNYFFERRVPSSRRPDRRREIDVVVVTYQALVVIEIKNWSGSLLIDPKGCWVQERRHERGSINHGALLEDLHEKADDLHAWLAKRGCVIPRDLVHHRLCFVNSNLALDPTVAAHAEVIQAAEVGTLIATLHRTFFAAVVHKLIGYFSPSAIAHDQRVALRAALAGLPTWDRIRFVGGRCLVGDFKRFVLSPAGEAAATSWAPDSAVAKLLAHGLPSIGAERAVCATIRFEHPRSTVLNYLHAFMSAQLAFRLSFLHREQTGWISETVARDPVDIPCDRVVVCFRPCNRPADAMLDPNEIEAIELSP